MSMVKCPICQVMVWTVRVGLMEHCGVCGQSMSIAQSSPAIAGSASGGVTRVYGIAGGGGGGSAGDVLKELYEYTKGGQCCGAPNLRATRDGEQCESCGRMASFNYGEIANRAYGMPPSPKAKVCECGGDAVKAGHSTWCPKYES